VDYVNLGKTGLKVSRICLGCMTYGAPAYCPVQAPKRTITHVFRFRGIRIQMGYRTLRAQKRTTMR
jgi:aryl-alcohol dehydrogenase-like predicted oxidoreductase